jgi:catechol 2,3-dioxygenase-like lactoylglutathione lyase family enzyme
MSLLQGFNHVATVTADLDRLIAFYEEAFDVEVVFD